MAFEALIERLARRLLRKGEDLGLVAAALNVSLARSMAALATRNLTLIVSVAEELPIHVGMARSAGIAADKSLGVRCHALGQLAPGRSDEK